VGVAGGQPQGAAGEVGQLTDLIGGVVVGDDCSVIRTVRATAAQCSAAMTVSR
jgi:hypothetical protein